MKRPLRLVASILALSLAALAPSASSAPAAVSGDVEIVHPSGTNPLGFEELLFADVADQVLGPIASQSPTGSTIATQGAFGEALLALGAIGLAGSTSAETVGFGTLYRSTARAELRYDETLSVTSATLAPGTPVDVSIRYAVAGDVFSFHDLDPALVAAQSQQQASTVRLRLTAAAGSESGAQPWGQPPVLPLAVGEGALGVAFGVEASLAGVDVFSPLLGGAFPDLGNATALNASDMLPPLPVPEPTLVPGLAIGAVALARLRRRRHRATLGRRRRAARPRFSR